MDIELRLRCNNMSCRKIIASMGRGCVTTCSHIFCEECATQAFSSALVCPACDTSLTDPDDIAFTDLNPSDNYKSSILSGLPPSLIHDIAGRALSFWVYQVTQEYCFQEMMQKQLEDKCKDGESQLRSVMAQANQEIFSLRDKLTSLEREREQEKRKAHEMAEQCADKGRQLQKMQQMYEKLKRKTLLQLNQQSGGGIQPVGNRENSHSTFGGLNQFGSSSQQAEFQPSPTSFAVNSRSARTGYPQSKQLSSGTYRGFGLPTPSNSNLSSSVSGLSAIPGRPLTPMSDNGKLNNRFSINIGNSRPSFGLQSGQLRSPVTGRR